MTTQQTETCHCSACGVDVAGDADTRRWDQDAPLCEPCWRWLRAERLAQRRVGR